MKKALIITLVILSMILTLFACNNPVDDNTDTDTDKNQEGIQPIYLSKDYYPYIECGKYLGDDLEDVNEFSAFYRIFTTPNELISDTEYGNSITCLKDIFDNSYVVLIARYIDYVEGTQIGYKRASYDENGFGLVLDTYAPSKESELCIPYVKYEYIKVPKDSIDYVTTDMQSYGELNLITQCFEYIYPTCVVVKSQGIQAGTSILISGESFEAWANMRGINASQQGFYVTEEDMVVCYYVRSPYCDTSRYTGYNVRGGTLTLEREVQSNQSGELQSFVELIKIPKSEIPTVGNVEVNTSPINIEIIKPSYNTIVNSELLDKESYDYLPTLNGGYYFGTDLSNNEGNYARIIRTYSDLKSYIENPTCVTEKMLDEYDVLVLKMNSSKALGRKNIGFIDYMVKDRYTISITMIVSNDIEWYGEKDQIEEGLDKEEKKDDLYDEYNDYISYILVPKTKDGLQENPRVELSIRELESNCKVIADNKYDICHGNGTSWLLKSSKEIKDFEETYNVNLRASSSAVFVVYLQNSQNISNLQGYEKLCMHGKTINLTLINGREKSFDSATEGRECLIVIPVADKNMINRYSLEFKTAIKDYERIKLQPEEIEDEIYPATYMKGESLEAIFGKSFLLITNQEEYKAFQEKRDEMELSKNSEYSYNYNECDFEKYDMIAVDSRVPSYTTIFEVSYKNAHYHQKIMYLFKTTSCMVEDLWDVPIYTPYDTYIDLILLPKGKILTPKMIDDVVVISKEEFDEVLRPEMPDVMDDREILQGLIP